MTLIKFFQLAYHHILPSICILCHASLEGSAQNICNACLVDLPILPNCCCICARFLVSEISAATICGACLKNKPHFERTFALFPYQPPIVQLIFALKFNHQLYYANTFARLLLSQIETLWYQNETLPDVIVPVPLHINRLRERGFNQALEIAKLISKKLKIPLDHSGVIRIKHTAAQSGLKSRERKQNLANAFAISRKNNFKDLKIAVIDDVITTGSTVDSLSKVLKADGAEDIHVWCCARRG